MTQKEGLMSVFDGKEIGLMEAVNRLFDLFTEVKQEATWKRVFGDPQTYGDTTLIPIASVSYGVGLGIGQQEPTEEAEGSQGAGGGSGVMSRPIAIIEVTPTKTVVRPVIDYTRVIIAGLLTLAWIAFLWANVIRKLVRSHEPA